MNSEYPKHLREEIDDLYEGVFDACVIIINKKGENFQSEDSVKLTSFCYGCYDCIGEDREVYLTAEKLERLAKWALESKAWLEART